MSKYIKGSALTVFVFVNDCLNSDNFTQITKILYQKFLDVSVPNFCDFSNLKVESMCKLEDYFHKKVDFGRK